MSKNEPIQTADAANLFASQKETDLGVDNQLADEQGAPPCNTAPPKYNGTHIIRAGIDSLYLSFHGTSRLPLLNKLQDLKDLARGARCIERQQPAVQLAGITFKVHAKGQGIYPFVISNKHFSIRIAGEAGSNAPPVYMQISSELLTKFGYGNSLDMSRTFAKHLVSNASTGTISRVDLCCDFTTTLDWLELDPLAWLCRSRKRSEYRDANHLTGYVFGVGGDVLARLYDKTCEIEKSDKDFFKEVWAERGWDGEQTIWRLEYQVRQQFLKSINATDPERFVEMMNSAWHYLAMNWLSLREPQSNDVNRSRWPMHPDWNVLCAASFNLAGIADITRARFEAFPSDYSIFTGALGYLTGFMAKYHCETLPDALAKFYVLADRHFQTSDKRTMSLDYYVQQKLLEKRTKFAQLVQGMELEK